jgi:hypothetical protein
MGYKSNKGGEEPQKKQIQSSQNTSLQKPSENAMWEDAEGEKILEHLKTNFTVQQTAILLKYAELFPNSTYGFEWVVKKAEQSVKKYW